jgi:hypothetical protein
MKELINQENQNKEYFQCIHIDEQSGELIKGAIFDLPLYGGIGVIVGNVNAKAFLYYIYRYKLSHYHIDKISILMQGGEETINYQSKATTSDVVQSILLIQGGKKINRVEFENLYLICQKAILMPSVTQKPFETISLKFDQ